MPCIYIYTYIQTPSFYICIHVFLINPCIQIIKIALMTLNNHNSDDNSNNNDKIDIENNIAIDIVDACAHR